MRSHKECDDDDNDDEDAKDDLDQVGVDVAEDDEGDDNCDDDDDNDNDDDEMHLTKWRLFSNDFFSFFSCTSSPKRCEMTTKCQLNNNNKVKIIKICQQEGTRRESCKRLGTDGNRIKIFPSFTEKL